MHRWWDRALFALLALNLLFLWLIWRSVSAKERLYEDVIRIELEIEHFDERVVSLERKQSTDRKNINLLQEKAHAHGASAD